MTKAINVYWAPETGVGNGNWNMIYSNPENLFSSLTHKKLDTSGTKTYLSCPASQKTFKNTYVFKNGIDCGYEYDFTNGNAYVLPTTKEYISYNIARPPTIEDGPLIDLGLHYSFFADEPLEATFTSPTFHQPKYTKYGTLPPGSFDIGQWYRPYPLELQMWQNKGELKFEYNEPLFYVTFNTNKKINLIRYTMTEKLAEISSHCVNSPGYWGLGVPLLERYKRFRASSTREIVLTEIKKNLIN
jgi:hypothetical protein